jgi:hypothetical protein
VVALIKGYKKESGKFSKNSKTLEIEKKLYFYPLREHEHCESNDTKKQEEHLDILN